MREGRWEFAMSMDEVSKGEAWDRCRRSGARLGIPEFAWSKNHDYERRLWVYSTTTDDRIEERRARFGVRPSYDVRRPSPGMRRHYAQLRVFLDIARRPSTTYPRQP